MANVEKVEAGANLIKSGAWTIFWLFLLIAIIASQCGKTDTDKSIQEEDNYVWVENNIVKEPFLVCFTKEDYIALQEFMANKDEAGAMSLHKGGRCTLLKAGARISIIEYNVLYPTKIRAYAEDGSAIDLYTSYNFVKQKS